MEEFNGELTIATDTRNYFEPPLLPSGGGGGGLVVDAQRTICGFGPDAFEPGELDGVRILAPATRAAHDRKPPRAQFVDGEFPFRAMSCAPAGLGLRHRGGF